MAEMVALTVTMKAAVDEEVVYVRLPLAMTLVGVSVVVSGRTGSPTGGFITIVEEVLDEVCGVNFGPLSNWSGDWRSRHFGGDKAPVALPANINLGVRIYLSGGTNPTANAGVVLWLVV